ncbi:MAG: hypothetical protein QXG39_03780 [Candidatus Aenigmatarchaeota archaeon]
MRENSRSVYREFLEAEYLNRKFSVYERLCNFFDRVKLPIPRSLENKLTEEINFCHLRITPNGVVSLAILLPILIFSLFSLIFYILNLLSSSMVLLLLILSLTSFYYLFTYTTFYTKYFRAKAASEMSMAIIYMSISLKINHSLEAAIAFAAQNLSGPIGLDLKKILWDLETGNIISASTGLDELSEKWRRENDEFVNAISLLKASINEGPERMEMNIREAVEIMLEGTKTRMKKYALAMRTPLRILNAFGLLLPLLVLIFFPMMIVFVPEIAKPELIAFSYIFLLPFIIYLFLKQYFFAKPYSYHQVEMKEKESFKKRKRIAFIVSIIFTIPLISYLVYNLLSFQTIFSTEQFVYSLLVVVMLAFSVVIYSFLSSISDVQKNQEILKIEDELPVALFHLSVVSSSGKPIEKNIEEILPKIKTLKIFEVFKKILSNIKSLGMTLNSAIFDEKVGVINSYPSRLITISFKLLVDISKKGMYFLSLALKYMSEFLKDANEVNNMADEILSETTSDMQIQAWIFAPLSAGIVVGLMAIVIFIFSFFGESLEDVNKFFQQTGFGEAGESIFPILLDVGKQIPFPFFQIIVGIYLVEVVCLISNFLGEINYGDDEVSKLVNLGKLMLIAIVIYTITVCTIYFGISSILNFSQLGGLQ